MERKCIMCGKPAASEIPGIGHLCKDHHRQMRDTTEEAQRKLGIDPDKVVDLNGKSGIDFGERGPAREDLSEIMTGEDDERGMNMLKTAHKFVTMNYDSFVFGDDDSYVFTDDVNKEEVEEERDDEGHTALANEFFDEAYDQMSTEDVAEVKVKVSGGGVKVSMKFKDASEFVGAAGFGNKMYERFELALETADNILAGEDPDEEKDIIEIPK